MPENTVAQLTGRGVEQVVEFSLGLDAPPCSAADGPPTTTELGDSPT
jgi:hypothetical protein